MAPDSGTAETETPSAAPTVEELTAERDKWRALSRTNEDRWKRSSADLAQLQEATKGQVEQAQAEARTAALSEVGPELVTAELRLQAVTAGAELPSVEFLSLDRFTGESGRPDAQAVADFIKTLPRSPSKAGGEYAPLGGAGHTRDPGVTMSSMDPAELADYIAGGTYL